MKLTIYRHEGHLKNMEENLNNLIRNAADQEKIIEKRKQDCAFLKAQIELAKKEKKDEFDADIYGFSRLLNF